MFEGYTYETVLARMLNRLPPALDRREGSFLHAALAPAAWELSEAYANLERALSDGFAATATRESLILLGRERGIAPFGATPALVDVQFYPEGIEVPVGFGCSIDGVEFTVMMHREADIYRLVCNTVGEAGNLTSGEVHLLDAVDGCTGGSVVRLAIPGSEEEETEAFRARYFETLTAQAFGGNRADYTERIGAIAGVGTVKILPAWNGEGTVKAIITNDAGGEPTDDLVAQVQETVDGFAPIGHTVTVAAAEPVLIPITATLSYEAGADSDEVRTAVMDALVDRFDLLRQAWHNEEESVIRISKIHACILNCAGVEGVTDLTVGGKSENLVLSAQQLPELGDMVFA